MSVESTNTPNGGSKKDLYSINPDMNGFSVGFMTLEEKQPDRENDNDSDTAGSNTVVAPTDIGEIEGGDIGKVGYVGINLAPLTPEIKKAIEDRAEKSKESHEKELEDRDNEGR